MSSVIGILNCRYPLIQGAMGVISNPEMVAAVYKKIILEANDTSTCLVNLGRFQVRALTTPLIDRLIAGELMPEKALSSLEDSWVKGDLDAGPLPAGQGSVLISSIKSVREIIEEMVKL